MQCFHSTSRRIAAIAIASLVTISATSAQARINERQERQQQRIAQGIQSGKLTAAEAARLEQQQASIARLEARSRADGNGLNRAERARIEHRQDHASHAIKRKKHNARQR